MPKQLRCSVQGVYRGYRCDSLWELAFVVFNLDHGIEFHRCVKPYPYRWYRKTRWYYPDFVMGDGRLVEIKGIMCGRDRRKLESMPEGVTVIGPKEIVPYMAYCRSRYGDDLSRLYERSKTVWYTK